MIKYLHQLAKEVILHSDPFSDWHKTISPAFVVCADFESVLQVTDDPSKPQKHMPCAAAYVIVTPSQKVYYRQGSGERKRERAYDSTVKL